jgi:hypothetical protein
MVGRREQMMSWLREMFTVGMPPEPTFDPVALAKLMPPYPREWGPCSINPNKEAEYVFKDDKWVETPIVRIKQAKPKGARA